MSFVQMVVGVGLSVLLAQGALATDLSLDGRAEQLGAEISHQSNTVALDAHTASSTNVPLSTADRGIKPISSPDPVANSAANTTRYSLNTTV